jgi:diadenosine tetraphosphatase ApaH/serine/threonine PP2A family protein phosphatase
VTAVAGNHDWAAVGKLRTRNFSRDARKSVEWTKSRLSEEDCAYLAELDLVKVVGDITLIHSDLTAPDRFLYIESKGDARRSVERQETRVSFVGHSHVPFAFLDGSSPVFFMSPDVQIPDDRRGLVNVGSVGQPRNRDPRACYCLYDAETRRVRFRQVSYDVDAAVGEIMGSGLPRRNGDRLLQGQ